MRGIGPSKERRYKRALLCAGVGFSRCIRSLTWFGAICNHAPMTKQTALILACVLHVVVGSIGCGGDRTTPVPAPVASAPVVAPSTQPVNTADPAQARNRDCPALTKALLGAWRREQVTETYAAAGAYSYVNAATDNRVSGRYRVSGDSVAITAFDETTNYRMGLIDANSLVVVNADDGVQQFTRHPQGPAYANNCFDGSRLVGTWESGQYRETYGADGSYDLGGREGTYRVEAPSRLTIVVGDNTVRYKFALTGANELVVIGLDDDSVTVYRRR